MCQMWTEFFLKIVNIFELYMGLTGINSFRVLQRIKLRLYWWFIELILGVLFILYRDYILLMGNSYMALVLFWFHLLSLH